GATTGASAAAAAGERSASFGCAAFVSASSRCAGKFPACAKPVGKRTEREMSVIDPVADMLTRVRNACQAGHRRVDMPVSKLKVEIARLLRDNHYVQDFKVLDDGRHGLLRLYLKYHNDAPVIRELQRVSAQVDGRRISVKGPKGEISRTVHPELALALEEDTIVVRRPSDESRHKALHGLTRTLVANMVDGVTKGFAKALEIQGVGYKA